MKKHHIELKLKLITYTWLSLKYLVIPQTHIPFVPDKIQCNYGTKYQFGMVAIFDDSVNHCNPFCPF